MNPHLTFHNQIFWLGFYYLIMVFPGYLALLHILSDKFFASRQKPPDSQDWPYKSSPIPDESWAQLAPAKLPKNQAWPHISLIIPAHNEGGTIGAKIENSLNLDYPKDRLEIIVISDGSSDNTPKICGEYPIELIILRERQGKINAMNKGVQRASGEIIVFSDANSMLEKNSLKALIMAFFDKECGLACGDLKLHTNKYSSMTRGEMIYWNFERKMREKEAALGALSGVVGSLYAIRKSLYPYPPTDTILDDLHLALHTHFQGYKNRWMPMAKVHEETAKSSTDEFARKIRLSAGGFQIIHRWLPQIIRDLLFAGPKIRRSTNRNLTLPSINIQRCPLISPIKGRFFSISLLFHKILRWPSPIILTFMLYSLYYKRKERPFGWLFNIIVLLPVITAIEAIIRFIFQRFSGKKDIKIRFTGAILYLMVIQISSIIGFFRFITKTQSPAWKKACR